MVSAEQNLLLQCHRALMSFFFTSDCGGVSRLVFVLTLLCRCIRSRNDSETGIARCFNVTAECDLTLCLVAFVKLRPPRLGVNFIFFTERVERATP
jgi:hypothetical protein|tara:strand:+ start:651 stop:938 length:288 start_codon:yes stop_codon:yes gene_type:complete